MPPLPSTLLPILLCLLAGPALAQGAGKPAPKPAAPAAPAPIGCPSLANYRLLFTQAKGEPAAAEAILADPKADHLGCQAIPRERVTGIVEHVALGGQAYECLGLQGTSICHWMRAGTVTGAPVAKAERPKPERAPAGAAKPAAASDKPAAASDKPAAASEKPAR